MGNTVMKIQLLKKWKFMCSKNVTWTLAHVTKHKMDTCIYVNMHIVTLLWTVTFTKAFLEIASACKASMHDACISALESINNWEYWSLRWMSVLKHDMTTGLNRQSTCHSFNSNTNMPSFTIAQLHPYTGTPTNCNTRFNLCINHIQHHIFLFIVLSCSVYGKSLQCQNFHTFCDFIDDHETFALINVQ